MITRRLLRALCFVLTAALVTTSAHAGPSFMLDTEADFEAAIGAGIMTPLSTAEWALLSAGFPGIGPGDFMESRIWASGGGMYNTEGEAGGGDQIQLEAGMGMEWPQQAQPPEGNYIGGWMYTFPQDPNVLGHRMILDVLPPMIGAGGFLINSIGIGLVDVNGAMRSWSWNCVNPPPPPPAGSMLWNMFNWLQLDITQAGHQSDAWHGIAGPFGPFPWDQAVYADTGFDPTKCVSIVGIENGAVPPGGGINVPRPGGNYVRSPFNWWGVVTVEVIPEPATLILLPIGVLVAIRRRRR